MKDRTALKKFVVVLVLTMLIIILAESRSLAFCPKHHFRAVMALESEGYFYSTLVLLAFFDIEVDLASEVPEAFVHFPLRWPRAHFVTSWGYVITDPSECFEYWVNNMLPFHSPGSRTAKSLAEVEKEWMLPSLHEAVHPLPGESCYWTLERFGHALHGIQDFYSHANWVEVFHMNLGFDFWKIPTWTEFKKAQRGERNLILLHHAGGDKALAKKYMDILSKELKVADHDLIHKDSVHYGAYDDENEQYHTDAHGHDVMDFHRSAVELAIRDTIYWGHQLKLNIINNPKLGVEMWHRLNRCELQPGVDSDIVDNYRSAIGRVKFYSKLAPKARWD